MNHANRKPSKDAAKKRRQYLLDVAAARTCASIGWIVFLFLGCIAAVFGLLGLLGVAAIVARHFSPVILFLLPATLFGALAHICIRAIESAEKDLASLPYVPPIREQLAALPADEVLLRGSEEPAAKSDELLRAARVGTAEPAEELLRAVSRTQRE